MAIRIFYKPDGKLISLYLIRALRNGETETQALDSETIKTGLSDFPFDDYDPAKLPDKSKREKWRGNKERGIWIDESIITAKEARAAKRAELDSELANPNADPVKVIRLNRELEKMK